MFKLTEGTVGEHGRGGLLAGVVGRVAEGEGEGGLLTGEVGEVVAGRRVGGSWASSGSTGRARLTWVATFCAK